MKNKIEAFTFGEPIPVMDARDILDYAESWYNGNYYEPPVSMDGLAKSFRANSHHSSAIYLKRNILVSSFVSHPLFSKSEFSRYALEYLTFGNSYVEIIKNKLGRPLKLKSSLAKFTRRTREKDQYLFLHRIGNHHEFKKGSIFHLMEHDVNQEMYGVPEYLAGLNSAWLNESATLFRRKYFENGSHAGFVMYITDTVHEEEDINNLRKALKDSKGPGNFKNLLMYAPGGKKDGIQLLPISEVAAKDEFFNIKNVTRDDILAVHRTPPQMMAVIPQNAGGFGSVEEMTRVFNRNEVEPIRQRLAELNDWVGEEVIRFDPYEIPTNEK